MFHKNQLLPFSLYSHDPCKSLHFIPCHLDRLKPPKLGFVFIGVNCTRKKSKLFRIVYANDDVLYHWLPNSLTNEELKHVPKGEAVDLFCLQDVSSWEAGLTCSQS